MGHILEQFLSRIGLLGLGHGILKKESKKASKPARKGPILVFLKSACFNLTPWVRAKLVH